MNRFIVCQLVFIHDFPTSYLLLCSLHLSRFFFIFTYRDGMSVISPKTSMKLLSQSFFFSKSNFRNDNIICGKIEKRIWMLKKIMSNDEKRGKARRGEARRDGKRQRSVRRRNGKPNNNNMMMLQSNYKLRTSKFMLYDKIIALEHELNMNTVPGWNSSGNVYNCIDKFLMNIIKACLLLVFAEGITSRLAGTSAGHSAHNLSYFLLIN